MGIYTFSCQMLMNPVADDKQGFKDEWLDYHNGHDGKGLNIYITVDAANEKKSTNDYTAIMVIGLGADKNYYILDMFRDRLNLTERAKLLIELHRKWRPLGVGYEKYGLMADVFYIKEKMKTAKYEFEINELGGTMHKNDRIRQLVPIFENKQFKLPRQCFKTNYEQRTVDLVSAFIEEEYKVFPVSVHDDMLDALARIVDPNLEANFPIEITPYEPTFLPGGLS
jgi:predicted phage terminase large subunit-like protein